MRIARFAAKNGQVKYGVVEGESIRAIQGDILGSWKASGRAVPLGEVTLRAPVDPSNIIALGRNYAEHAKEGAADIPAAPAVFLKATSAVTHPGSPILLPKMAPNQVDYEAELAVIIGKAASNVREEDALQYVFGYTCGNDVSARDCQRGDLQWARAKSFNTFAPLGPWMETELDAGHCPIACRVNGRTLQESNTSEMVFSVPYIISYLSRCMILQPGTVIMTGTPSGCGFARKPPVWLRPNDVVEVEIGGIGVLRNPVMNEE